MDINKYLLISTVILFGSSFTFVSSAELCSIAKHFTDGCTQCNFLAFGQEKQIHTVELPFGLLKKDIEITHACGLSEDSSEDYCCYNWHRKPYCCSRFGQIVNGGAWLFVTGMMLVGIFAALRYYCIHKASQRARGR
ncbi:uncharacterized protein LOC135838782 [Planococcus citri]|uniref:uncharacterized protein LOC135838782 n=1 Tax=Planococcus citri TaxID=170843 RepID=UPI0031F8E753